MHVRASRAWRRPAHLPLPPPPWPPTHTARALASDQLSQNIHKGQLFLNVDLADLSAFDSTAADALKARPTESLQIVRWTGLAGPCAAPLPSLATAHTRLKRRPCGTCRACAPQFEDAVALAAAHVKRQAEAVIDARVPTYQVTLHSAANAVPIRGLTVRWSTAGRRRARRGAVGRGIRMSLVLRHPAYQRHPRVRHGLVGSLALSPRSQTRQSDHISTLVRVPGIIIAANSVQAKATRIHIICRSCGHSENINIKAGLTGAQLPRTCPGCASAPRFVPWPGTPLLVMLTRACASSCVDARPGQSQHGGRARRRQVPRRPVLHLARPGHVH